jgi:UDPglucose 6-dehydrogenase
MEILIIGTGYVGTTTGLVFCEMGHKVTGLDLDEVKLKSLQSGTLHFYEPGLDRLLKKHIDGGNISFTNQTENAIRDNDIIFICVGTPQEQNGSASLRLVKDVAESIGKNMNKYKVIVTKSTVPVGTSKLVGNWIKQHQLFPVDFDIVSNPEFLREGSALKDALQPDRIVLGSSSSKANTIMKELYKDFNCPILETDLKAAELIKYAANSFLALKISYINEISRLCDALSIDVIDIANGIGLDKRIGGDFLKAGLGYGGSCLPKDVSALLYSAYSNNVKLNILEAAVKINQTQFELVIETLRNSLMGVENKRIAVLGLSFKPNTDDIRESPSIKIVDRLVKSGAIVNVHDPIVNMIGMDGVTQFKKIEETVENTDAILLCTEWDHYKEINWREIKNIVKSPFIFDCRNFLDRNELISFGFKYKGIGR